MGPEAASIAGVVAKSAAEVDRSPGATQRASDVAQEKLVGEYLAVHSIRKTDAADSVSREKIRHERERRRRQLEREGPNSHHGDEESEGPKLDVVA